eukprot:1154173-Pelagomonas_calceolata.AAC.5
MLLGTCTAWHMHRLAHAPLGTCTAWHMPRLAHAPLGTCTAWHMHCLAHARFPPMQTGSSRCAINVNSALSCTKAFPTARSQTTQGKGMCPQTDTTRICNKR